MHSLDDDEFEELCTELMRRKGFLNVRRMSGPGSGDRGRDIHAEENLISASDGIISTRILAQCKNYWRSRTSIGPGEVETLAQRARTLRYNRILTKSCMHACMRTILKRNNPKGLMGGLPAPNW